MSPWPQLCFRAQAGSDSIKKMMACAQTARPARQGNSPLSFFTASAEAEGTAAHKRSTRNIKKGQSRLHPLMLFLHTAQARRTHIGVRAIAAISRASHAQRRTSFPGRHRAQRSASCNAPVTCIAPQAVRCPLQANAIAAAPDNSPPAKTRRS